VLQHQCQRAEEAGAPIGDDDPAACPSWSGSLILFVPAKPGAKFIVPLMMTNHRNTLSGPDALHITRSRPACVHADTGCPIDLSGRTMELEDHN
jgi:hypothetical protein